MKSVIVNEGVEGKQSHVEYEYKNRKYNRFEREDYGYERGNSSLSRVLVAAFIKIIPYAHFFQ